MKNNNAFLFPLYIRGSSVEYYCMMYYALETLYKTGFKNEFDLFVYYCASDYQISSHRHFDGDEDIFKDFPDVNFINFPYDVNTSSDVYFFKWKFVDHFFKNFSYEKVFITDADLIFYQNPSYMFEKYSEDSAHVLWENSDPVIKSVLGRSGMAGGQLMISKKLYESKLSNLYSRVIAERDLLLKKAKLVLQTKEYDWFDSLSDQYSLMNAMLNSNVVLDTLDVKDICYGASACDVSLDGVGGIKVTPSTNILHYLGPYAYLFLPDRLKTSDMRVKFREKIQESPLIYY